MWPRGVCACRRSGSCPQRPIFSIAAAAAHMVHASSHGAGGDGADDHDAGVHDADGHDAGGSRSPAASAAPVAAAAAASVDGASPAGPVYVPAVHARAPAAPKRYPSIGGPTTPPAVPPCMPTAAAPDRDATFWDMLGIPRMHEGVWDGNAQEDGQSKYPDLAALGGDGPQWEWQDGGDEANEAESAARQTWRLESLAGKPGELANV